jgi:uncharacterized protein YgfB (UPF0149 family)
MRLLEVNEHKIKVYQSADELPIKLYSRFQVYKMVESGVGSDMPSVMKHFHKLFEFSNNSLTEAVSGELKNLYYNFFMILQEVNLEAMSFAMLVHSIDDEVVSDRSEEALVKVIEKLSEIGVTQQTIKDITEEAKKKINDELRRFCPYFFNEDTTLEYFAQVKRKIAIIADLVKQDLDTDDRLKEIDKFFALQMLPLNFDQDSQENAVLIAETQFENLLVILQNNGVTDAEHLTTKQFYLRLDYFRKESKKLRGETAA